MSDFRCIRIERAQNGFTMTVEPEPKRDKEGMSPFGYNEKPTVYESADSLIADLKKALGGTSGRAKGESAGAYAKRAVMESLDDEEAEKK